MLLSGPDDEHSAGADTTLSPDALDLVTRAKAAVDADPQCAYKVSCADILALAARDVVSQVLRVCTSSGLLALFFVPRTRLPCREFVAAVVSLHVSFGATDEQRGEGDGNGNPASRFVP